MKSRSYRAVAGFTVMEIMVVVVIVGILSAIAAPSFLQMLTRQRVNSAQAEALTVMREAQANAKREKRAWAACFRNDPADNKVKWAISPVIGTNWTCANAENWNSMLEADADQIKIDTANTNFRQSGGYYTTSFDYKGLLGNSDDANKKITFVARQDNGQGSKRCVYVVTLLGAMRADSGADCNN